MAMLEGYRILDLSRFVSGPFCSMMLSDMGADVIKIEVPGVGDNTRKWTATRKLDNPYFLSVNRNKRSLALNFQHPEGRDVLLRLVATSDVIIHNLRPGTFESHGFSYDVLKAVNPRIILCEISGYGKSGPDAERAAFDLTIQAESGLMSLNGDPDGPPVKVGVPITDVATALTACIGIQGALLQRARTGVGCVVATSMLESALSVMPNVAIEYLVGKIPPLRWGNGHPNIVPYAVFAASDGWVTIGVGAETQWKRFCDLIGRPDLASDDRYATNPARLAHRAGLEAELAPIIARHPRLYWRDRMAELGLPSAPVNGLDDTLEGPQVAALGTVQTVEHAQLGPIRLMRSPLQIDGTYLPIRLVPPMLGEHTDDILRTLAGLGDDDIARLRANGTVG